MAYSSDLAATIQFRSVNGEGAMAYVGNGVVLMHAGGFSPTLFRTTDKGLTWSDVDPTFGDDTLGPADELYIYAMAWNHVEANGSIVLFYGDVYRGDTALGPFWRSTDGGQRWQHLPVMFTDGYAPRRLGDLGSIAMSPEGEVLASVGTAEGLVGFETGHIRLLRSLDAGDTWQLAEPPEPLDEVLVYASNGQLDGNVYHFAPIVFYWPQ